MAVRTYSGGIFAAFRSITDHQSALAAARATTWAAGYLCLVHVILTGVTLLLASAGLNMRTYISLGSNAVLGAAAGALAVLAWRSQPRWGAIVVLIWAVISLLEKIAGILLPGHTVSTSIFLPLILTGYAVGGVRGAFALRRTPSPVAVFD